MNRFLPDPFIPALLATVVLASLFPVSGEAAVNLSNIATAAVMLLFFLHGVKLPRENLVAALKHWRLHVLILGITYLLIPVSGLALSKLWPSLLPDNLWTGVLFLCALPSTVQMSIALTSVGKGNVAASVTSAAASNLLGVVLTPLIAGLLLHAQGGDGMSVAGIWKVAKQLLLPFAAGHLLRPWLAAWASRQKTLISWSDRLTILISVYSAFSAAVMDHIWSKVPLTTLLIVLGVCFALFSIAMFVAFQGTKMLRLPAEDTCTSLFGGSFKSLVSGVPMARVLFPPAEIGVIILPIMIYHQMQMMLGANIATRMARSKS